MHLYVHIETFDTIRNYQLKRSTESTVQPVRRASFSRISCCCFGERLAKFESGGPVLNTQRTHLVDINSTFNVKLNLAFLKVRERERESPRLIMEKFCCSRDARTELVCRARSSTCIVHPVQSTLFDSPAAALAQALICRISLTAKGSSDGSSGHRRSP